MLDLKLLEKQLDEVLSKETSESISSWLNNRRLKNCISAILGDGEFNDISVNEIEITQSKERNITNKAQDFTQDCVCDFDYLLAA